MCTVRQKRKEKKKKGKLTSLKNFNNETYECLFDWLEGYSLNNG